MLINLVGPPAAGKSTFAARFILEHPEFKFCSIDSYRIEFKNELEAWARLQRDLLENKNAVLESCGLSWRLRGIFNTEVIRKRMLITIAFVGDIDEIKARLLERQKRPVPFPYKGIDEMMAVDYVSENLNKSIVPIDLIINTSNTDPIQQYYKVCDFIAAKRIEELSYKGRRKFLSDDPLEGDPNSEV